MPIYMDRHDLPGVTAEDVAGAHQEDLKVQDQFSCRGLTYWFDEERGTAFCLIEAPDKASVQDMHDHAHGLIPHKIIEVDSNVVNAFLGRIEDPTDLAIIDEPAFRTIMWTVLKDAALMKSKYGVTEAHKALKVHDDIIRETMARYNGREVKHSGDGFVVSFTSASKALLCALDIDKRFKAHNKKAAPISMDIAIGLSAGSPVTDNNDLFGQTVLLAKRLCDVADKGQVMVSFEVKELLDKDHSSVLVEEGALKALSPKEEEFLTRLMDITEQVWDDEGLNVLDLGKQLGVSKAQLYRKTTALTGKSPNDFIREFRLNKAIQLIEKQQGNISEVAFRSGFSSPSYFSKCFQDRFGIVPSDYATTTA